MSPTRNTLLLALLVLAGACTSAQPTIHEVAGDPGLAFFQQNACGLPASYLTRTLNGYHPARSGQIQIVPRAPNTVGNWFSHAGPWPYLQDVPLFFYGPGQVPAMGRVNDAATLADVAPTVARFAGFDFDAPDGSSLSAPLSGRAGTPPRLVVVMVWDAGGDNVLDAYPDAWPVLRSLVDGGVWYEQATVGSSPSISAPVHATIGTGAFPRHHGSVDHWLPTPEGMVESERLATKDKLMLPGMADLYDRSRDNAPVVGVVAPNEWHLQMAGLGSAFEGGDHDLGASLANGRWSLGRPNRPFYAFPDYVTEIPRPDEVGRELDGRDGTVDDAFRGDKEIVEWVTESRWQTLAIDEIIPREGFGADEVTDLLFVNYKQIDEVSHIQTMNSPAMRLAVQATDGALKDLIAMLDQRVGKGRWVLAVTADHGATPKPEVSGGFQIGEKQLRDDITAAFDRDDDRRRALRLQRPTQIWVDQEELRDNGFTLGQVARFVLEYTKGENAEAPGALPEEELDDRVFSAAFPSSILPDLPCLPQAA